MGAYDIKYMPRTSVKGQVLANFVAEFIETPVESDVEKLHMDEYSVGVTSIQGTLLWKFYVDGASNLKGSKVGLVLISPEKITIEKSLSLGFWSRIMKRNTKLY